MQETAKQKCTETRGKRKKSISKQEGSLGPRAGFLGTSIQVLFLLASPLETHVLLPDKGPQGSASRERETERERRGGGPERQLHSAV